MSDGNRGSHRWYVLILSTLTIGLGFALPTMCLPVLFKEIAGELGLNLVQVGIVWGVVSLSGLAACLIGGMLGDRFGLRRIITIACLLTGVTGASRGLAGDFISLVVTIFVFGFVSSVVMINIPKISKIWFLKKNFGLVNGIQATGMSLGFTLGAMVSATVLSPWLGGWRHVLYLYGLVTAIIGLFWLTVREPGRERPGGSPATLSMRQSIIRVSHVRNVWLLGCALSGYLGCMQGVTGYLPLYLHNIGWSSAGADGALAVFNIAGAFGAIPMALLSDRLGLRKFVLLSLLILAAIGTTLLPFYHHEFVWVLAIMIGFTRDAAMTLFIIMTMELKEIDVVYAGTALGLLQTLSRIGGVASPPLGNSLAAVSSSTPYFFWAALAVTGVVILCFVKETGQQKERQATRGTAT